jgi:hypothetical protein
MNSDTLVSITVSRKGDEVIYKVDCAKDVKSEELAHYLDEIIEGICTWKPEVCEETVRSIIGTIPEASEEKTALRLAAKVFFEWRPVEFGPALLNLICLRFRHV